MAQLLRSTSASSQQACQPKTPSAPLPCRDSSPHSTRSRWEPTRRSAPSERSSSHSSSPLDSSSSMPTCKQPPSQQPQQQPTPAATATATATHCQHPRRPSSSRSSGSRSRCPSCLRSGSLGVGPCTLPLVFRLLSPQAPSQRQHPCPHHLPTPRCCRPSPQPRSLLPQLLPLSPHQQRQLPL